MAEPTMPPTMPRNPFAHLPQLVRFMLAHAALGFGLSTLFIMALLMSGFGGLAGLMRASDLWPLPPLLLWFFCGLTFGSVQMGTAIILLGNTGEDGDGPDGGRRSWLPSFRPTLRPVPVPVPAHPDPKR